MPDPAQNVFDGGTPTPPAATPPAPASGGNTPPANNLQDLLKNIKNENGEQKYKTLEDALVALDNSQKYIPELKSQLTGTNEELARMKEQVAKFGNIEDTVQRLLAQQQIEKPTTLPPSGLDEQAVLKLVQSSLKQSEQVKLSETNLRAVNDALVAEFGEKAVETLESKAQELGTTRQALGELAKTNPKLVMALFPKTHKQEPSTTTSGRRAPPPVPSAEPRTTGKSMLSGVSAKEQATHLDDIRRSIYAKHGIE